MNILVFFMAIIVIVMVCSAIYASSEVGRMMIEANNNLKYEKSDEFEHRDDQYSLLYGKINKIYRVKTLKFVSIVEMTYWIMDNIRNPIRQSQLFIEGCKFQECNQIYQITVELAYNQLVKL